MKKESIDIKIIVATHKQSHMPLDSMYYPLQVGKKGKDDLGYIGDDTGDNISHKNSNYCELTGLYWGWKNIKCDYLGLVHYRRHFMMKKKFGIFNKNQFSRVLSSQQVDELIPKYQVIVPKKRNYYIETLYTHYKHTHYIEHLDITYSIISEKYPMYLKYLDKVYASKSGYMFNMFIMEKNLLDKYCEWLFNILFELEKRVDVSDLSQFQSRFLGRVSEIIFNCWIMYHIEEEKITIKEIDYIHIGKINRIKKCKSFFKAKFLNKKYDSSF